MTTLAMAQWVLLWAMGLALFGMALSVLWDTYKRW
jgi:hypothetical protein